MIVPPSSAPPIGSIIQLTTGGHAAGADFKATAFHFDRCFTNEQLEALLEETRKQEREECAKIAEDFPYISGQFEDFEESWIAIGQAIRARGKEPTPTGGAKP